MTAPPEWQHNYPPDLAWWEYVLAAGIYAAAWGMALIYQASDWIQDRQAKR